MQVNRSVQVIAKGHKHKGRAGVVLGYKAAEGEKPDVVTVELDAGHGLEKTVADFTSTELNAL